MNGIWGLATHIFLNSETEICERLEAPGHLTANEASSTSSQASISSKSAPKIIYYFLWGNILGCPISSSRRSRCYRRICTRRSCTNRAPRRSLSSTPISHLPFPFPFHIQPLLPPCLEIRYEQRKKLKEHSAAKFFIFCTIPPLKSFFNSSTVLLSLDTSTPP
jgi:hypothetical protein